MLALIAGQTPTIQAAVSSEAPTSSEILYRITTPALKGFVAGILVKDGRVVHSAPILGWTLGKTWFEVKGYFHRREWKVEKL